MEEKMIIVPLNTDVIEGKEQFLIWQKREGDIETFRVPSDAELNTPVAFWLAGVGVVAFGRVISSVFIKDDIRDRNDKKHVAEVILTKIFCEDPIKSKEISSQVKQFPTYVSEELLKKYM